MNDAITCIDVRLNDGRTANYYTVRGINVQRLPLQGRDAIHVHHVSRIGTTGHNMQREHVGEPGRNLLITSSCGACGMIL